MAASSFPRARRFARTPVLFASVQIGDEAQGLILNGSEGGICVQITAGAVVSGLVGLRFQSARPARAGEWIRCRGKVVWTSDDHSLAGIEFIEPTIETSREIGNWLSFGESLRELRREWPADQAFPAQWSSSISHEDTPEPTALVEPLLQNAGKIEHAMREHESEALRTPFAAFGQNDQDTRRRSRRLLIAVVAVAVFVGAGVLKVHKSGWNFRSFASKTMQSNQSRGTNHTTASPAANAGLFTPQADAPPPANPPSANLTPDAALVPHGEAKSVAGAETSAGLMLQAGAMTDEQNAKEMAQSLQQKHFPAFVYKKDGDRFFRVFIGPYASDQALGQAQAALRSLNIPTIKKKSAR